MEQHTRGWDKIEACPGDIYKSVPEGQGIIQPCTGMLIYIVPGRGGGGGGGGVSLHLLSSVGVYG